MEYPNITLIKCVAVVVFFAVALVTSKGDLATYRFTFILLILLSMYFSK